MAPVKNCTWHRSNQWFWNVSINWPFHAPILEVSVWTPTPSPKDEVCNISKASVTNNVPIGAIPHQPMCVKCCTVDILCRNLWEKKPESHRAKHNQILLHLSCRSQYPCHGTLSFVLWDFRFFLGINNRPTYIKFLAKMNSGFWPTTQNLQNQRCCCMGLAKQQGQIQWQVPIRLHRVCSTMLLLSRCHSRRYFTSY